METENEMVERAINEVKYFMKKKIKWIILFLIILIAFIVFLYLK